MTQFSVRLLILIFVIYSFLGACTSKIPYGSTYYFPLEPKEVSSKKTIESIQLQATIDKLPPLKPSVATQIEEANIKIDQWVLPVTTETATHPKVSHNALSKKEQRKVVKAQIKALKSERKQAKKQQKQQRTTKNIRNGIILGVAGLIMMIIFGAAGIGILVGIGAIVLLVGIVLILLDLLEV